VAVAAAVVAVAVDKSKRRFFSDGSFILQSLFLVQGMISFAFGLTDIPRTYDLADKMVKIWILGIFMRVANRDRLQLHTFLIVVALSLGVHGVLEGLKYIVTLGAHKVVPSAAIGDNNNLALAILMVLPFFIYIYQYSTDRLLRLIIAGIGCIAFVGLIATSSRGGLVGLAVLALTIIFQSRRKALSLFLVFIVAIGLFAVAPSRWTDRMETIKSAEDDNSFMERVISWKLNTILALDRPLLGGGYSALEDGRVFEIYAPHFGELDFIQTDPPTHVLAAHSIYFSVLGDLGFIGLLLFLAMLASGFVNVRQVKRLTARQPEQEWAYGLAVAFQRSLLVYMVAGAALSVAYFEILYIELSLVSILRRSVEEAVLEHRRQASLAVARPGRWNGPIPTAIARR
jgi:probable O-glycosylation ligase (exosortase A-associated)